MWANFKAFSGNYLQASLALCAWWFLTRPRVLLALVATLAVWGYLFVARKRPISFTGRRVLNHRQKLLLCAVAVFFIQAVVFRCLWMTLMLVAMCGLVSILHAALRPAADARPSSSSSGARSMDFVSSSFGGPKKRSGAAEMGLGGAGAGAGFDPEDAARGAGGSSSYDSGSGGGGGDELMGAAESFAAPSYGYGGGPTQRRGYAPAETNYGGVSNGSVPASSLPRPAHVRTD